MSAEVLFSRHGKMTIGVLVAVGSIAGFGWGASAVVDAHLHASAALAISPLEARATELEADMKDHELRLRALERTADEIRTDTRWIRAEMERRHH